MNDRRTFPELDSLGYDDQVSREEEQAHATTWKGKTRHICARKKAGNWRGYGG